MNVRALTAFLFLTISVVDLTAGPVQRESDERFQVRIRSSNAASVGARLEAAGYDVVKTDARSGSIELVVSSAELRALERRGYRLTIVDRTRPLEDVATDAAQPAASTASGLTLAAQAVAPPTYRDLEGVNARLHEIAAAYPAIAQVVDVTAAYSAPATAQGRHIFALKISDNVAMDEDEPAMLIVSAHHAREVSTPVISLTAAERLTAGYATDPRIASAVNGHEIWIAPVMNPDGYNHVFTADNMWRKNRRPFTSGVGVDQNRNYPQGWGASCAGSTSVASETYKGPAAASEAETQTLMLWSRQERFAKVIDYHSYGREVLYGYRCLRHPFTSWMQQEAAALSRASGYGGHTRLPSAEGEHPQWQFGQMGAYAFLIETHTQFQPSYSSAVNEAALVWPGILAVLERPVTVFGHVTDAVTGAPLEARIDLLNVSFSNGETNASGGRYGAYHMFLPPGTYDIRFSAPGHTAVVNRITVTNTSSTPLDVQLAPTVPDPDPDPVPAPTPTPAEDVVVFFDDFETNRGWTRNAAGGDTASSGRWERGDPQSTSSSGPKQLGSTVSGRNNLVTGRLAGSSAGSSDVDGGRTSIQSPAVAVPAGATTRLTFNYYLAHGSNSSAADYLRVTVLGPAGSVTVLEELGDAVDDDAVWATASADLSGFAGQAIRILIEAADAGPASLVEAAVDDVRVVSR
jgi:Zinc carboxypeptidase/Carboxypeptidase regulatory-like domain